MSTGLPDAHFGQDTVILNQWQYVKWLAVVKSAADYLLTNGCNVQVLDISQYSFPRVGSPQNSLALKFGMAPSIQKFFTRINIGYAPLATKAPSSSCVLSEHRKAQIQKDVEAQSKSFFRDTRPNTQSRFYKKYIKINVERSAGLYIDLMMYFQENPTSHCVIPNGRYASQRAAIYAAEDSDVVASYIEVGTPNSFYWESFPVHDRLSSQLAFKKFLANSSVATRAQEYKRWIEPRMISNSRVNDFTKHWKSSSNTGKSFSRDGRNINVFFTSSRDEFEALGKDWHLDAWEDQYEAFDAILHKLSIVDPDSRNILRVHPNLLNKGPNHKRAESARLEWIKSNNPNLEVIPPDGSENSYDLMRSATRVFVANSTLGLEASSLKKPVWTSSATYFDEVADIRKLWSRDAISDENLQVYPVDPKPAKDFISYLVMRERPLTCFYEDFNGLDPVIWPLRKRSTFLPAELSIGQITYWLRRSFDKHF